MNRRLLSILPAGVLAAVVAMVPLPVFLVQPGPARDVEPLIRVRGHDVFASEGHFLLTTVTVGRATTFQALRGWLDEAIDVVSERDVLPRGVTEEQDFAVQLSAMDESKLAAAYVALSRVTDYPSARNSGTIVQSVVPGSPAHGRLFAGDLIVAAGGRAVADTADLTRRIRQAGFAKPLELTVRAGGQERTVHVQPGRVAGVDHPAVGVALIDNFPFPVTIESGDIGGPSAGLMWAIGLTDLLTPGDLSGGRRIAGTGTIGLDGRVGPIGGIVEKMLAARLSGAKVFLVPRGDLPAARAVGVQMELVPVDTYDEALRYLTSTCGGCGAV